MMRYFFKSLFPYIRRSPQFSFTSIYKRNFSSNTVNPPNQQPFPSKDLDVLSEKTPEELSLKEYEFNRRKAADLVKVFIQYVESTALENCLKCLYVSITYKIVNEEFLRKFEKKIIKKITEIEPKDLSRIIFGLYNLGYTKSGKLNFMIERSIKKHFDKFTPNDFTVIFKSFAKAKVASQGLINFFNHFIEKSINSFTYYELVDILIHYPRIINQEHFKYDLFFKLYSLTNQGIDKLEINRLVNLYFVFYGGNDSKIRENIKYDQRLLNLIISKEANLLSKHIYLLFLTHHFSKIPLNNNMISTLKEYMNNKMHTFIPEELSGIINILNDDSNRELFKNFDLNAINKLFIETVEREFKSMDAKELILYLHTLLPNQNNFKQLPEYDSNFTKTLQSLYEKENEFKLNDINNILQLFHFTKSLGEYTIEKLSNLTLEKLRKNKELQFQEYNVLMVSMIANGNNNIDFWKQYLNYIKLYEVRRFEDYIALKTNLEILEDKVKGILDVKDTIHFLENKYESEEKKSIENI